MKREFDVHAFRDTQAGGIGIRICPRGEPLTDSNAYIALEYRNGAQAIPDEEKDVAVRYLLGCLGRAYQRQFRPATILVPSHGLVLVKPKGNGNGKG